MTNPLRLVDDQFIKNFENLSKRLHLLEESESEPVDGGGGGGDDGGMDHERRISQIERVVPTLATKEDLKKDLETLHGQLDASIANVRADINKAIAENVKWTHTATIGMFGAFVLGAIGLLFTMWNAAKQTSPAPQQQPAIIINVPQPAAPVAPQALQVPETSQPAQ